jgi:hypothetical protein
MEARVLLTDDVTAIADKIFELFEINQSCKVEGTVIMKGRLVEKGRAVLDRLQLLDEITNTYNGKRKRTRPENSVGGYEAHKIFKYQRRIVDDEIRYTIWRHQ